MTNNTWYFHFELIINFTIWKLNSKRHQDTDTHTHTQTPKKEEVMSLPFRRRTFPVKWRSGGCRNSWFRWTGWLWEYSGRPGGGYCTCGGRIGHRDRALGQGRMRGGCLPGRGPRDTGALRRDIVRARWKSTSWLRGWRAKS